MPVVGRVRDSTQVSSALGEPALTSGDIASTAYTAAASTLMIIGYLVADLNNLFYHRKLMALPGPAMMKTAGLKSPAGTLKRAPRGQAARA
jgi:hypothetical protein